jgi:predicted dehydrogenase
VLLLWLTGRNVRRVFCSTGNYFFSEHQENEMEDFGQLLMELDGGLIATISAGRTGWRSHPGGGFNRAYLAGEQGAAVVDAFRPRVEVWGDVPPWMPPARNPEDPMGMWETPPSSPYALQPRQAWVTPESRARRSDAEYFLDCIEQGRQSDVSVQLAAAATEALMAAYQSAATGRAVATPL